MVPKFWMTIRQHCPLLALQYTGPMHMAWANILAPIPPVTAKPPVAINEKNVVAAVDVANINAVPPATTGKKTKNN